MKFKGLSAFLAKLIKTRICMLFGENVRLQEKTKTQSDFSIYCHTDNF